MKEIKVKILESIATKTYNKELTGDRVKLLNKINKLQMLVDCINELHPIESEFVLPEIYCFKTKNQAEFVKALNYFKDKYKDYQYYETYRNNFYFSEKGDDFGFHRNNEIYKDYTEITFEQFKKYVLNERV